MNAMKGSRGRLPSGGAAGFTLVELMVALALAAMIAVAVMVISNQAQDVYKATTRKVEVYNKFRFALLATERDFGQWIPTGNLEFFADGRGANARRNENWDPGEEFPDTKDDRGPYVVDGGTPREFDEFAYIIERHYWSVEPDPTEPTRKIRKLHDAYQAYFRTMTFIDGRTREANVEYMLLDPNRTDQYKNPLPPVEVASAKLRDLTLYKIVRYHDFSYREIEKPSANFPVVRKYVEVCTNLTDFRLEYTADNRFDAKVVSGFRTPAEDFEKPTEAAVRPRKTNDPEVGAIYKKIFGYGSMKIQADRGANQGAVNFPLATAYKAVFGDRQLRNDHHPVRFGFAQNPDIKFAELTPGDRIYIFTETSRGQQNSNIGVAGNVSKLQTFDGTYTVKTNLSGRLELREDIDSVNWRGDRQGVRYKAAFLPEAIRLTLRVLDDDRGDEPKTLTRVVWVRQKAR
jgi:prepilin-type N-terminal cleavage/methylation domain-containing protein